MTPLLDALASYVEVLLRAAHASARAEDRSAYTGHLAAAAEIFACLHSGRLAEAKEVVSSQKRAFGRGYLSGDEGASAAQAFERFASVIDAAPAS